MTAAAGALRKGAFARAVIALSLIICVEVGAHFVPDVGGGARRVTSLASSPDFLRLQDQTGASDDELRSVGEDNPQPPGLSITYLALIDGILLFTIVIMLLNLVGPRQAVGRLQGVAGIIAMIVLIIAAILMAIIALIKLIVMVSLFLAAPFGTLAYLVLYGTFDTGAATVLLAILMTLKLVFCVQLVWGQQRFLQMKGLVALIATSLLLTLVIGFAYGLVPVVLVSIIDALVALIIAIVAIVWALVLVVGGLIGAVRAIA